MDNTASEVIAALLIGATIVWAAVMMIQTVTAILKIITG
jgi:hypothetical protein